MKGIAVYILTEEEVRGDIRVEVAEETRARIRNLIDSTVPSFCEGCGEPVCFPLVDLVDKIVEVIEEEK